jgi:hypothetical protein
LTSFIGASPAFCRDLPIQLVDHRIGGRIMNDGLKEELAAASAELKAHMASWEYAFAMGSTRDGGANHPLYAATHARTEALVARYRDLRARVSEHEL